MTAAAPQQILGSYVIERELGRGGMGAIYLGVHQTLGKRVAIKLLLPELSRREDLIARFWAEARAVTAIKHASIVDVYDYGATDDGRTYIVMEYLEGESLGARLKARGVLPIPQAVAIARQIAHALAAAHAVGVVHRDLKPDNIILVDDPEVAGGQRAKLLDFGVAKLVETEDTAKTVTGALLGTPHYMSPEQCEGARAVDHRSDLYSLGCTLFQMVSGRLPFESPGIGGLIGMHLHVPPPKLRDRAGHASEALERIVARLLEKQPAARFSSAAEVVTALSAAEASEVDASASAPLPRQVVDAYLPTAVTNQPQIPKNVTTEPPPPPTPAPAKRGPRSRWSWLGASVGLVGTVALVALMASKDGGNSSGDRQTDVAGGGLPAGPDNGPDASVPIAEPVANIANVSQLLQQKQWIEAGLRARELEATGLTPQEIDQILSSSSVAAARDVEARIETLAEQADCGTAITEAQQFSKGWRRVALRATILARGCTIERTAKGVYDQVADAFAQGRAAEAVAICKKRGTLERELRMTCALIACMSQDRSSKTWLAGLEEPDAETVIGDCTLARAGAKD